MLWHRGMRLASRAFTGEGKKKKKRAGPLKALTAWPVQHTGQRKLRFVVEDNHTKDCDNGWPVCGNMEDDFQWELWRLHEGTGWALIKLRKVGYLWILKSLNFPEILFIFILPCCRCGVCHPAGGEPNQAQLRDERGWSGDDLYEISERLQNYRGQIQA